MLQTFDDIISHHRLILLQLDTRFAYCVPITFNVPASTPSGRSVTLRKTKTGLLNDGASS